MDARSERLLKSALDNIMRGRTTLVIAHRLTTILRADTILVVNEGRIIEQGTHSELIRARGLYREFYDMQFGDHQLAMHETAIQETR
jgi:ABC-type multidrug transport system fused ATPase/permease subunit